jgi:hypothetical protein
MHGRADHKQENQHMSIQGNNGVRREPFGPSGELYHRLVRRRPDLLAGMYTLIEAEIGGGRFDDPKGEFPNSSWLGQQIIDSFTRIDEWMEFCGQSRDWSRGLFGVVMWTVMYDDTAHDWQTLLTENANPGREERVYFLSSRTEDDGLEQVDPSE